MACDTFIKIAMKCRRYFVQVQVGEAMPFIDEILNSMATIISDLQPQQVINHLYIDMYMSYIFPKYTLYNLCQIVYTEFVYILYTVYMHYIYV